MTTISCGSTHVFAITNEHEMFSWGRGDNGFMCFIILEILLLFISLVCICFRCRNYSDYCIVSSDSSSDS